MEENFNQNISPVAPVEDVPTPSVNQPPLGSWWRVGILVVGVLLVGSAIFYAGYQYSQKQVRVVYPIGIPTFLPTPTPIADETANWKIYTNDKYNYNIKYPNNWSVKENNARDTVGNQIQNVTFYSPTKDYVLTFGIRNSGDVVNIVGKTGVSAGDFVAGNPVPFDGTSIPTQKLVYEGKTKAIFYQPSGGYYKFGNFEIYADFNRITFDDYESRDIENLPELAIANKILSTFKFLE